MTIGTKKAADFEMIAVADQRKRAPKIEFNTVDYRFNHGREPRGRGSWAFFPTRECRMEDAIWSPSMTFSEAKKWVRKHPSVGAGRGYIEIFVGS